MTTRTSPQPSQPDLIVEENSPFDAQLAPGDLIHLTKLLGGALQVRGPNAVVAHTVGHVVLPSGRLLRIRSRKAPAASILAWSAYVDPMLGDLRILGDAALTSQESDVAALVARLFLAELARALGMHGIAKTYGKTATISATIRGRIDFSKVARQGGDASRIACQVWERRPRSSAMMLLAATLRTLAADPVMRAVMPEVRRHLLLAFSDVPSDIDALLLDGRAGIERNEHGFLVSVVLARLALRHVGLGDGSLNDGLAYLVGLDRLFERAVVRALQENGIKVRPKHQIRHERIGERGRSTAGTSAMELDALCPVLAQGGVVVDAKYKDSISSSNLHQMVAYCALTGARQAVLAIPSQLIGDRRSYRFDVPKAHAVTVHLIEFDVDGADLESWRRSARTFANRVKNACATPPKLENGDYQPDQHATN